MNENLYDIVVSTNKDVVVTKVIWLGYGKTEEEIKDKLYELRIVVMGLNFHRPDMTRFVDASKNIDIDLHHR